MEPKLKGDRDNTFTMCHTHTCRLDVYSHLHPPPKKFFWAYLSPWRFCRRLARLAARPAAPSLVVDVWGSYLNFLWNFTPTLEDPVDGWDGWMTAGLSASRRNFFEKHVLLYKSLTNQDITLKFGQLVLWTISIKCGLLLHDGFLPLRGRKMHRKRRHFPMHFWTP